MIIVSSYFITWNLGLGRDVIYFIHELVDNSVLKDTQSKRQENICP